MGENGFQIPISSPPPMAMVVQQWAVRNPKILPSLLTARIFHSQSTYTFSVFRHSLRLHFYPSSYNQLELDPYDSFFGVTAAGFTLLTNFSASITAYALTQAYIVRDFSLPKLQGSPLLHLTFTPSHNSFAFINGIEIISMPMPEIFHPAPMLGFSDRKSRGECLKQYMETAVKCLGDHSIDLPSMGEVLWNLEYCVELQNNPGGPAC